MNSKFSSIYAGLGMGLLLGLIMGLSVSPTVQTVMGVLATALGGFLAHEKSKPSKTDETNINDTLQDLRLGSFGFAVVIGILFGLITRTNELFAPTISERINQWTDAGYSLEYSKKLVLFQKLGIDPNSGETKELGIIQKTGMQTLFSSEQVADLATNFDPDKWNNSIENALSASKEMEIKELDELVELIKNDISPEKQFIFLKRLQIIFYNMNTKHTAYKFISDDNINWKGDELLDISDLLIPLNQKNRDEIISAMKSLFSVLESK